MKNIFIIISGFILFSTMRVHAQTSNQIQPYSYDFYQKLNKNIYDRNSRIHSSLKPYLIDDSLISRSADSVLSYGIDTTRRSFAARKLFNEHLVEVNKQDFTAYIDFLPDVITGKEFTDKKNTWLYTRGYQIGGTVGKKFSFYTSGYENQGLFPAYYAKHVDETGVVPGQSYNRTQYPVPKDVKDWSYVSALISYTPNKYLNITLGQDKNFIGDGYRSMLLSDFASNYPFLKLTGNLGNVQYMVMWAGMQDPSAPEVSYQIGHRKKGGVFHYLDWNVNNRLSLGFFESVIWAETDSLGNRRGFDLSYANPVVFLRPLEATSGSPDNVILGFTGKYELLKKLAVYGQFALDEFEAKNAFSGNGSSRNKWGLQLGARGSDLFNVNRLNYLFEFNTARPYTYSERAPIINYAHYNEPLAHPYGANFRELMGIMSYSYKRFNFHGQMSFSKYGLDEGGQNYGKDIFQNYDNPAKATGNYIGQGLATNLYYTEGRVSYLLNPKYNLRLEAGGVYRRETNSVDASSAKWLTIGLRSTFRNLYQDF
jgi:hypothetical protein